MAKKKSSGVNKRALIREYLEGQPEAANKDVAAALSPSGVTPQDVANLKARKKKSSGGPTKKKKKKTAARKKKKKAASARTGRATRTAARTGMELSSVQAAAEFVASMGSVGEAQRAIDAAAKIAKKVK